MTLSDAMEIRKICAVGAGTMGRGITQVSAQAGYETTIVDVEPAIVERGLASIKDNLARMMKKGSIAQESADEILSRIHPSTELKEGAKDADYVIEAVFERTDVKLPVLEQLDNICKKETILASNTSGIPISLLASRTKRPEKVIGMHFMNPVPVNAGSRGRKITSYLGGNAKYMH